MSNFDDPGYSLSDLKKISVLTDGDIGKKELYMYAKDHQELFSMFVHCRLSDILDIYPYTPPHCIELRDWANQYAEQNQLEPLSIHWDNYTTGEQDES